MPKTVADLYGHENLPGFKVGLEFEVEQVEDYVNFLKAFPDLHFEPDHSLRDNGMEFITPPVSIEEAVKTHKGLVSLVKFAQKEKAFSFRTSTHVHVNFLDVNDDKVKQFIYLYSILEPYYFDFVSKDRQNNIFCVPLFSTTQSRNYGKQLKELCLDGSSEGGTFRPQSWHKYAAFNILPLARQGTIEFRHLEGTPDSAKVEQWLKMIKALYDFNLLHVLDFSSLTALNIVKQRLHLLNLLYTPKHDALMESIALDIILALNKPDVDKILEAILARGEI